MSSQLEPTDSVAFENELMAIERSPIWDPKAFDTSYSSTSYVVSALQIPQIVLSIFLNGLVLWLALWRRRQLLLVSAGNVLTVSVCLSNFLFAWYLLSVRIRLVIALEWSKAMCMEFSIVCVFFVCHMAINLMAICFERYLSLVLLKRAKRKYALVGLGASAVSSLFLTMLHHVPEGGIALIGRAGIYCYPTRAGHWQGAVDAAAMVAHFAAIFLGYMLIFLQLRSISRKAASAMQFPDLGQTTLGNLGHQRNALSGTSQRQQGTSNHSNHKHSIRSGGGVESSATARILVTASQLSSTSSTGGGTTSLSGHTAVSTTTGSAAPDKPATTLTRIRAMSFTGLKRKASIASMASSMVSAKNAEGKVVLRGMLSLSSYTCFVVSYSYLLWTALLYGRRPSVQFDWFLVSTKFIPDFCEPLILFLLDRQFKEAFKEMMGWE